MKSNKIKSPQVVSLKSYENFGQLHKKIQKELKILSNNPIDIVTIENPGKEESIMRIEAFNQVQQLYNSNKTTKNQKTDKPAFTDQLQISSIGKDIQTAKQAVIQSPDIRENVTAPLKQAIQSGTYSVNGQQFADKLLEKYYDTQA